MATTAQPSILIVDDEEAFLDILLIWLRKLGYENIHSASNSDDALAKAAELKPDLVLMDIMLPGSSDGVETAWNLNNRYGLRVIYITAYADQKTIGAAKSTRPYGYLVKPFTLAELDTTIKKADKIRKLEEKLRAQPITDNEAQERLESYREETVNKSIQIHLARTEKIQADMRQKLRGR